MNKKIDAINGVALAAYQVVRMLRTRVRIPSAAEGMHRPAPQD